MEFSQKLNQLIKKHRLKGDVFAVGVSGGADSLALAFLLKESNVKKIVALTVDHGLRKESADEAQFVAKMMKKHGIEHHILNWKGKKPSTGLEEAAREARYALLENWCIENKVKNLFVAHHKVDQAETFLMRLQRGSGVSGLSAMSEFTARKKVNIIRPLLSFGPEELRDYLLKKKISWVDDPHNYSDDFLRVRVRKLLPELDKKIGLSVDRICDTAKRMARAKDCLDSIVSSFVLTKMAKVGDCSFVFAKKDFTDLHEEIGLRVLSRLLQDIGGKVYPTRMENLERLYEAVLKVDFKSQTLLGCEVLKFDGKMWIIPEVKGKQVLLRKDWGSFVQKNKIFEKMRIPHKLRLCLVLGKPILSKTGKE